MPVGRSPPFWIVQVDVDAPEPAPRDERPRRLDDERRARERADAPARVDATEPARGGGVRRDVGPEEHGGDARRRRRVAPAVEPPEERDRR